MMRMIKNKIPPPINHPVFALGLGDGLGDGLGEGPGDGEGEGPGDGEGNVHEMLFLLFSMFTLLLFKLSKMI